MIDGVPPFVIFMAGALLVPWLQGWIKKAYLLFLPVLGLVNLLQMPAGESWPATLLGYQLVLVKIDSLSLPFGVIFLVISFLSLLYCFVFDNDVEYVSGLIYAGAALGAVFAGDLLSFYLFWEVLALAATFLILERRTPRSEGAALRYLLFHIAGGLTLLVGLVLHVNQTGSLSFGAIELGTAASYLIFLGFGVNCAWPVLHTWLSDAYPESTIGGVLYLSAFTTKTAVYALARCFEGADPLIWIGTAMAAFPIFYAVIENDLRRVLAYSLINQVGFMVVGIGIGTELAVNGAVAHAVNDILFKALLFMTVGAVMYRTGTSRATDLGGLYRSMPWTCAFCIVGAASISAFPLFSGFVSKSMVTTAAAEGHMVFVWFVLIFASAGVFHHAGIKIPFFAFFSHDAGHRVEEAPRPMLLAMGVTAALCIVIGTFPHQTVYPLLPYPVEYAPYTPEHIMAQTQLLFFSALAFSLMLLAGVYPAEIRSTNLDADWVFRKGGRVVGTLADVGLNDLNDAADHAFVHRFAGRVLNFARNAPARLVLPPARLVWGLQRLSDEEVARRARRLEISFVRHSYPVGASALFAIVLLGILILF